jgi:hypothetical protein
VKLITLENETCLFAARVSHTGKVVVTVLEVIFFVAVKILFHYLVIILSSGSGTGSGDGGGGIIPSTQRYYRRLFLLLNTT